MSEMGARRGSATGHNGEVVPPAVDAATILLLQRTSAGTETLLLERHLESEFGGALVFPGGVVDDTDRTLPPERWTGRDPAAWRHTLGAASDAEALGLMVGAVRETFEEAGVLLATRRGRPVTEQDLAEHRFVDVRRRLAGRGERFDWSDWLEEEDLVLDLAALAPWSWWVTPKEAPKRFDTRFFLALLPPGQSATHDHVEMTSLRWLTPRAALSAHERGRATVVYPTRKNLEALAAHDSPADAWRAADEGRVDLRRIELSMVTIDDEVFVQHPYEAEPEKF